MSRHCESALRVSSKSCKRKIVWKSPLVIGRGVVAHLETQDSPTPKGHKRTVKHPKLHKHCPAGPIGGEVGVNFMGVGVACSLQNFSGRIK